MAKGRRLDSNKTLREIQSHRRKLKKALQSGDDLKDLHADIVRLLKVVCATRSEYREVLESLDLPEGMRSLSGTPAVDKPIEVQIKTREQLATKLDEVLVGLEKEYKLRVKLEPA